MSDDFVSYKDAMGQLGLGEDELNELVARGELRAFRDGDEVRFKHDDIASIRKSRETEPTIVLSDTQADDLSSPLEEMPIDLDSLSTEETVLNIEGLLEDEAEGTTPIPGSDLLEDDGILEGSIGDDTVLDTDDLDLDGDFDLTDDDTILAGDDDTLISGGGVRSVQMVKKQSHPVMTSLLVATLLVALCPLAILLSLVASDGGTYPFAESGLLMMLNPLIEGIVGLF